MKRMLFATVLLMAVLAMGGCHGYNPNASVVPNPPPPVVPKATNYSNVPADAQKNLPPLPYGSQTQ
jgi:hypothetical protein